MKYLCVFLVFSWFVQAQAWAQDEQALTTFTAPTFEKVYLHTDRPHYFLKDTIWVKAYAWSAMAGEGLVPSKSQTLYMALKQQSTGETVFQTAVLLDEGMGSAFFPLGDVPVGDYVLIAQSPTMRAWDASYAFQKPVKVSDVGAVTLVRPSNVQHISGPLPYQNGLRIGLNPTNGNYQLIIERTIEQADSVFQLIGLQHGKPMYEQILSLHQGRNVYTLDSEIFMPGLADVALINEQGVIVAERTVYFHPQAIPTLKITTDQQSYKPRERVQVLLNVLDEFEEGLEADFSVSVVDSKQVSWPEDISSIVTEMELGTVLGKEFGLSHRLFHQPNAVREINDVLAYQKSRSALSNFNRNSAFAASELDGISIRGRAMDKDGNPLPTGVALEFLIYPPQSTPMMVAAEVEEDGTFKLEDLYFEGKASVVARKIESRKKRTYSEVLESHQLVFESIALPSPTLQTRFEPVPERASLDDIRRYTVIRNNRLDERIIELDTFTVKRQPWTFGRPRDTREFTNWANLVLETPERGFDNFNVFQYMQGRIPGMIIFGNMYDAGNPPAVFFRASHMQTISSANANNAGFTSRSRGGAAILLDGVIVDPGFATLIFMPMVKRIEVFNSPVSAFVILGPSGAMGAVNIITKDPNQVMFERNNVAFAQGYQEPLEFPKMHPGNPEKDLFKANWNATVYWNPYLSTDSRGKGEFEFVLNDLTSELTIIVEGMSKSGRPVMGVHRIIVE